MMIAEHDHRSSTKPRINKSSTIHRNDTALDVTESSNELGQERSNHLDARRKRQAPAHEQTGLQLSFYKGKRQRMGK